VKCFGNYERKISGIVKWFGKHGRKVSWNVKRWKTQRKSKLNSEKIGKMGGGGGGKLL
jgi:hypothetical protein